MSTQSNASSTGIGLGGLLTVLFIGLKLTGFIDWSWWWVISPIWLPAAVIFTIYGVLFLIIWVIESITKRK